MKIIILEGLPYSGKSTIGIELSKQLTRSGLSCIYRHGQITESPEAKKYLKSAFNNLSKWENGNTECLQKFLRDRYFQILKDYLQFRRNLSDYFKYDIIILDRYLNGHHALNDFLGMKPLGIDMESFNKFVFKEIFLKSDYEDRLLRAMYRDKQIKPNKFSQYILANKLFHDQMQEHHCEYFSNNDRGVIMQNTNDDFTNITGSITNFILEKIFKLQTVRR